LRIGKWLDVNLKAARLVRFVGDPISVVRKLCKPFIEIRLDDWKRLSISLQWQCPDVKARFGLDTEIKQEAAVRRPIGGKLGLRAVSSISSSSPLVTDFRYRFCIRVFRFELNTMRTPSGDQTGKISSAASKVNRLNTPRASSTEEQLSGRYAYSHFRID